MSDAFQSADESASAKPQNTGGIKDTFESILIALILAFVFRAFVVEAFVIPTGSMATTLLGAHMRFTCEDCGYEFKANFSAPPTPGSDDVNIPRNAELYGPKLDEYGRPMYTRDGRAINEPKPYMNLTCPNCGYKVPPVIRDNPENDALMPPVHYGDRILVLKYAYLVSDPKRWDVIVFKSPYDQAANTPRPVSKPDFQQNYIKRLIGLPGEELMIAAGDIYTRSSESAPWTVQTKPRHVQDAVWRLVADNDYQPRGLSRGAYAPYRSPWVIDGASPFTPDARGSTFSYAGQPASTLRFDPTANDRKFALTDWLAFDANDYAYRSDGKGNTEPANLSNVSDVQLRLTYHRMTGDGPMRMALTKLGHRFTAEFLPGSVKLLHTKPDGSEETLGTAPVRANIPINVMLENVDYRVALCIDGKEAVVSTPQQYAPDVAALVSSYGSDTAMPKPTIEISAANQSCSISHLSLWRDIYYMNPRRAQSGEMAWASPENPIKLKEKEFFVLGDNSALSLDARFWNREINLRKWEDLEVESGRVPERFLLGKAFFVYWPAGHRPTPGAPGIIPDFGDMRLIH